MTEIEIEVTAEMIKAGEDVLNSHYLELVDCEPLDEVLRSVFVAMTKAHGPRE